MGVRRRGYIQIRLGGSRPAERRVIQVVIDSRQRPQLAPR